MKGKPTTNPLMIDTNNGQHPDKISKKDYLAAGHELDTAMKTIRKFCLSCVDGPGEVLHCTAYTCPLFPYRLGKYPKARSE